MLQRLLAVVAISTMFVAGVAIRATASQYSHQPPSQSESQATASQLPHAATGRITSVSGNTFSIEIGQGDGEQTMQFITDSETAKSGDLKVGSTATVEYRRNANGTNMATRVDIQG